jgi:outer membrane protein assembly factor BamD
MPDLFMRSFRIILFALFSFGLAGNLSAKLTWTAEGGWSVAGGAFSGLAGQDVQRATELMNKARAAEERDNRGSAIKTYARVAKRFPNSVFAPEALFRQGNLLLDRRQYYKAFQAFQSVMSLYPNNERFGEVLATQYQLAESLMNGARNYHWGWLPSFRSRERAITYFEWVVANAPFSDYAPLALMNIARTHQRLNNTPFAIDALDRLINNYSQSLLAPDAYLALAQTHASLVDGPAYDQESTREAITYFEDFMIIFPDDPGLAEAQHGLDQMRTVFAESKMILGDYQLKHNQNFQGARVFYNEAITSFPGSEVAERARAQLEVIEQRMDELGLTFDEDGKLAVDENAPERPEKRKKFLGIF